MTDVWDEIVSARIARREAVLADVAARVAQEDKMELGSASAPPPAPAKIEGVSVAESNDEGKITKAKTTKV